MRRGAALILVACLLLPCLAVAEEPAAMDERPVVVLQILDKITARVTRLQVQVGTQAAFGRLVLVPRLCRVNPPSLPPEAAAFLEIGETEMQSRRNETASEAALRLAPQRMIFSGWMFASSPALSALEHPVYDVVVLGCRSQEELEAKPQVPVVPAAPAAAEEVLD